jgi:hypothetical protein
VPNATRISWLGPQGERGRVALVEGAVDVDP